jgi:hypothetical protein
MEVKQIIKELKLAAIQHKNKSIESTPLTDPIGITFRTLVEKY